MLGKRGDHAPLFFYANLMINPKMPDGPALVVHDLAQAVVALESAAALDRAVVLVSPPAAAGVQGALWFSRLLWQAAAMVPGARFQAVLDCGDHAGRVLESLSLDLKWIVFVGEKEASERLAAIAEAKGARLMGERPPSVDLSASNDAAALARSTIVKHY